MRQALELMLRRGELLLESNMGGSEALVVNKKGLDLLVLRAEPLFQHGGVRGEPSRPPSAEDATGEWRWRAIAHFVN